MSSISDELTSLKQLLDQGIITQEEFDAKKTQILNAQPVSQQQPPANQAIAPQEDSGSFGWAVLGFFIPLVGLILYLVWKDSKPNSAKSAGRGALVSVIISIVCAFFAICLGSCAAMYSTIRY